METLRADLRHSVRTLARRPAYFFACAGTLALVIGANAAIFAVANATLLRPVPFAPGDRTVQVYLNPPGITDVSGRNPLHAIDLVRFRQWSRTMTRFESFSPREKALTGDGEAEVLKGAMVTAGLFEFMGETPQLGRFFSGAEDQPKSGVAIISHGLWVRRYGAEPAVIGRRIVLDGEPHEIVGVMRRGFPPPFLDAEVFTPIGITESFAMQPQSGPSTWIVTFAQLRDGAAVAEASREVDEMIGRIARELPRTHHGWSGGAATAREWLYGELRLATLVLMAATAFVLLMACANIANLTLAQALARRGELSLRLALGASRRDLVRLAAVESLLVSGAGAAAGLLLAYAAIPALLAVSPEASRTLGPVAIDWRVQLFTVLLAGLSAVLAGVLPAVRAVQTGAAPAPGQGSARTMGSRFDGRVRRTLLVAQTALCLALLVAGGVLLRSFERAAAVDPGFRADHVLTALIRLPAAVYDTPERRARVVESILQRIRALPGVEAAGTTQNLFQPGFAFQTLIDVEHQPAPDGRPHTVHFRRISPGYFRTMRIRELSGRTFTEGDTAATPGVAVVSRQLAERHWPGQEAVGRRIRRGGQGPWITVVGVVDDVSDVGLGQAPEGTVYIAFAQNNNPTVPIGLVVRTAPDPLALVQAVRAAVFSIDPNLPVSRVGTLESFLEASLAPQRFRALVLTLLAGLGLLLSAVGIYGVTARGVAERTREIGVRLALGSAPRGVLRLVVVQALAAVGIGAAAGAAGGVWLSLLLAKILTGVVEPDAATGAAAAALLAATALTASVLPAARVLRLDPVRALRAE